MSKKTSFTYEIHYTKAAEKFLKDHEAVRTKYEKAIWELLAGDHPERVDVKKIRGRQSDYYRIRIGSVRIIYTIINGKIVVIQTLLAGPRGDVYKKMR